MNSIIHLTQRKNGQRSKIAVIKSENFNKAFGFVTESHLSLVEKTFLLLSMSGGLRFTECFNLRPVDINLKESTVCVRVLKKKKKKKSIKTGKMLKINPVYRWVSLHPLALKSLTELLEVKGLPNFARIFDEVKRSTLDRHIREVFGKKACHHSVSRHSHITYRLHELKESPQVVAEQMQITLEVASGYNHIHQKEMVRGTWKKTG
jgi:integrase